MISEATTGLLQGQVQRAARSLLQYVNESFPWTRDDRDTDIVRTLQQMAAREEEAFAQIARFLLRQRTSIPPLPQFPMHFTTLNFLALDRLLHLLVEDQTAGVADTDAALAQVSEPDARAVLQKLADVRKQNLAALNELQQAELAPAG